MYSRTSSISLTRSFAGWKLSTCNRTLGSALTRQRDRYLSGGVLSSGILQLLLRFFLLFAAICVMPQVKAANEVILSPIDPAGTTRAISLFSGSNLPANSFIRIGTFANGGTSEAELSSFVSSWTNQATTSSFLDFLNTNFVTWNSLTNTNANSPWPGASSISLTNANSATNLVGKPMYIWIYNTSTHAAATNSGSEMLILRSWETNSLGDGFPDKDGGSFGPDSNFNFFPSGPSGIDFPNPDPDDPLPITSYGVSVLFGQYFSDSFRLAPSSTYRQIFNTDEALAAGSGVSKIILNNFGANSFSATGLPSTITLNPTTGLLSGTFSAGTFTITASNTLTGVSVSKTLTYTETAIAPVVTGINPDEATFGSPAIITIDIQNGATSVAVAGLPAGLTHSGGASLRISGTPTQAGVFNLVITAANSAGEDTQRIPLTVLPGTAPVINTSDGMTISAAQDVEYLNTTNTNSANFLYRFKTDLDADPIQKPISYTLPSSTVTALNGIGVFLNPANGVLFGTPTTRTNILLPITIANAAIGSSTNFTLSVKYAAPELAVTSGAGTVGKAYNIPLVFTDRSRLTSLELTTIPPRFTGKVQLNVNQLTNATLSGTYTGVPTSEELVLKGGNEDATNSNLRFRLTMEADTGKPNLTSTNAVAGKVGLSLSFQLAADNSPTSYAVSGTNALPPGLSLNTSSGLVSGIPTEEGTFGVNFTASNGNGTGPAQTVQFTIDLDPPTITSPSVALGTVGSPFSFTLLASPNPTTFLISSGTLPEGLSLSADTGVIAGTPKVSGTFVVGVKASNSKGLGSVSTLTFSLAGIPPAITSVLTTTGNAEQPFTYQIVASNEATSYSLTGTLPNGLSLNTSTGLISGTPNSVFEGTVTITATNASGSDNETLKIVINPVVVILTSTEVAGTVGTPLSLQLTANPSNDLVYSVGTQKLPSGLEITSTGLITGTPLSAGSSAVTLRVVRRGQTTEDSRYTKVNFSLANPDFVAPDAVDGVLTFRAGEAGRSTISPPANFVITSVTTDGVPEGLSWNGTDLAGTPTTANRTDARSKISFTASLTTALGVATVTTDFLVRVSGTAASLTLPEFVEVEVGKETRIPLTFGGTDVALSASGVPPGLSIINGTLIGTNTSTNGPAEWKARITADNTSVVGGTSITREVSIRLRNPVPVMTNRLKIMAAQGRGGSLNLAFDALSVDKIRPVSLPEGVTLVNNKLSVAPSVPAGVYRATIQSENQERPGDPASVLQTATGDIRIFVDATSPAAVAASVPTTVPAVANNPISVQLVPADAGVRISGFGLPPGLSIDSETGILSGTPAQSGKYTATVFVQNGKRWIKKKVSFVVR
jgi:large repetitive protein